jgi:hypothetical protein
MKPLQSIFEGIFDDDTDIDIGDQVASYICKLTALREDPKPHGRIEGDTLYISAYSTRTSWCARMYGKPKAELGIKKIVFEDGCYDVLIYGDDLANDISIKTPGTVNLMVSQPDCTISNFNLECKNFSVSGTRSKLKFSNVHVEYPQPNGISIPNLKSFTHDAKCSFKNVVFADFRFAGKPLLTRFEKCGFGKISDKRISELLGRESTEEELLEYYRVDIWKTLGLKKESWPDLDRIVTCPPNTNNEGGYVLCKTYPRATPAKYMVDLWGGWRARVVYYIYEEKSMYE